MLDYSEINTAHRWEQFAEAFFCERGARIIQRAAVGQDGGADLIIEDKVESEQGLITCRILVSCKFYLSQSIGISIEKDILDRIIAHNCNVFYGFYSINYSSKLQEKLDGLIKNSNGLLLAYHLFDDFEIERFLKDNLDNNLFKNNFETSFNTFIGNTKKRIELNTNFKKLSLEDLRDKKNQYFTQYYSGESPVWSIIRKYTFQRDVFQQIVQALDSERIALVTGAGGEGKSTLLMQLGMYYFDKKIEVYYSFDGVSNIDILDIQFDKNRNYLLIIDQVNYIDNLLEFIQKIKLRHNIKLLLASRRNEWIRYLDVSRNFKDLQLLIGKNEFVLKPLSQQEILLLGNLLKKEGVLHPEVRDSFEKKMRQESDRAFLLATMIFATKGQKFEYYVLDVINNINKWENGYKTLRAICFVVGVEILNGNRSKAIYCSQYLLLKLMEINPQEFYQIKKNLMGEAFFQQDANKFIHTRNPLIAEIYFKTLILSDFSILPLLDVYAAVIHEATLIGGKISLNIIERIPPFVRKLGLSDVAVELLKRSLAYRHFFKSHLVFIDDLIATGEPGDYLNYSARWLLKKASEMQPRILGIFSRWLNLELKHGSVGDFTEENSIRWICRETFRFHSTNNVFLYKWALIEAEQENIGDLNFEETFSARWLFYRSFTSSLDPRVCLAWAKLEGKCKNIGDVDFQPEFSVRWLLKITSEKAPSVDAYAFWANIEIMQKNFGDLSFNMKYSARWLLREHWRHKKDIVVSLTWAKVEVKLNNLGEIIEPVIYSARWILREAFPLDTSGHLAIFFAKIEVANNNLGSVLDPEPFTARWILGETVRKVSDEETKSRIIYYWARLEAGQENYGSGDTQGSALHLLQVLQTQKPMEKAALVLWSAIHFYLGVDDANTYSPKALFEGAKKHDGKVFYRKKRFNSYDEWASFLKESTSTQVFQNAALM
ncbi:MAG: hypothetical protein ABW007_00135 [Chitinophagaceae bacterium]